jgi:plasmid stabilization system protein ParE
MAEVIFSARAIRDIERIHAYIAKDSIRYANGQVRRIINAADLVATYPRGGRVVPEIGMEASAK